MSRSQNSNFAVLDLVFKVTNELLIAKGIQNNSDN